MIDTQGCLLNAAIKWWKVHHEGGLGQTVRMAKYYAGLRGLYLGVQVQ